MSGGILSGASEINANPWTPYTPSWTSSGTAPSLGNGTLIGSYNIIGQTVVGAARLIMGSTTTFGTGNYFISTPFTLFFPSFVNGMAYDSSAGQLYIVGGQFDTGTRWSFIDTAKPGVVVSNTTPFTWAQSDELRLNFVGQMVTP